jgi:hypothetical protein
MGREFALRLFAAALVIVGIVLSGGAATALSISPNPVNATKPGFDADLNLISIVGDTMTVQVSVNVGTLTAFEVSLLTDGLGGFSFIPVVSSNAGTGDVAMANLYNVANQGFFGVVNAGQTSDEIVLQFDAPITQGWTGNINLSDGIITSVGYTIVPEPGTLALVGTGLIMMGSIRRRRAAR